MKKKERLGLNNYVPVHIINKEKNETGTLKMSVTDPQIAWQKIVGRRWRF